MTGRYIHNWSFKSKMIGIFTAILVCSTIVTGTLYYTHMSRDTISNYERSSEDLVRQIVLHLDGRFQSILQRTGTFTNNMSFVTPMKTYLDSTELGKNPVLAGRIAETLTEIRTGDGLISSMYVCTPKEIFDDYSLVRKQGIVFEDTDMYRYFVYHPSETVAWFSARDNELYEEQGQVIPLVFKQKISNRNLYFVINISQKNLEDYLKNTFNSYEWIGIIDKDSGSVANYGEQYTEAAEAFAGENILENEAFCKKIRLSHREYLATCAAITGSGWRIIALNSVRSLTGNLRSLRLFILAELLVSLFLCLTLSIWSARRLTRPLEQLAETMKNTVSEEFHEPFDYPYHDEIGTLAKSYNHMIQEIAELVQDLNIHIEALKEEKEQVRLIQKQKRKAELQALQAQINPHFLYNTLNMITWQAVAQGAEEISIISSALGKYFRLSLSRGKEVIPVCDELEHVRNYLEIQKIRYKNQLTYEIASAGKYGTCEIPKLVLQPLVENALYHGIKDRQKQGKISVSINCIQRNGQSCLEFTVEDDGVGIEGEKLELLNYRLENYMTDSESGYGIYNVNNRIELNYGAGYGLHLESTPGVGTRSILWIPCRKPEGGEYEV